MNKLITGAVAAITFTVFFFISQLVHDAFVFISQWSTILLYTVGVLANVLMLAIIANLTITLPMLLLGVSDNYDRYLTFKGVRNYLMVFAIVSYTVFPHRIEIAALCVMGIFVCQEGGSFSNLTKKKNQ